MKPLKLKMQAFGTFTKETVIDFTPLHDKVFLIFGKTGSGKTTIFDAICYALYGGVTGELRNKNVSENIRSTNADDKTPTYVEYEFEINQDIYVVNRRPGGQQIYKKTQEYKYEKAFIKKNGELIQKKKADDVTRYICEDVIKLTKEQFKQTMMISQGDFAALIKARSDDRTKIFRSILGTYNIDLCSQKLKEKVKELSGKCEISKNSLVTSISFLPSELFDDEYKQKLKDPNCYTIYEEIVSLAEQKLKSLEENNSSILNEKTLREKNKQKLLEKITLSEANNKNVKNYQDALAYKEVLTSKKNEYDALLTLLDNSNKSKEVYEKYENYLLHKDIFDKNQNSIIECEKELAKLEQIKPSIENNYALIPSLEQEKDIVSKNISTKEDALSKFKDVEDCKIKLDGVLLNKATLNEVKLTKEKQYKQTKEKYEAAQIYVNNNASVLLELDNCKKDIETNEKQYSKYKTFVLQYNNLVLDETKIATKEDILNILINKKVVAEGLYLTAKGKFILNQAGYIAKNLKENEPCPVCGSLSHPHPCQEYDKDYTQDKVDELEKVFNIARDEVTKCEGEIKASKSLLDSKKQNLVDDINDTFSMVIAFNELQSSLDKLHQDIKLQVEELNNKKAQLQEKKNIYLANKAVVDNVKELIDAEKECEDATTAFNKGNEKLTEARTKYETLLKTIDGQNKESIEKELNVLNVKKVDLDTKIKAYRKEKTDYDTSFSKYDSALNSNKSNTALLKTNFENAEVKLAELESKYSISRENAKGNILLESLYNQNLEKINYYKEEVSKNEGYLEQAIKNGYDKLVIVSTDELNKSLEEESFKIEELQQQIEKFAILKNHTQNTIISINDAAAVYKEKSKDYTPYKELSDTFAGEVVGQTRIAFETFYQVQFFKQILLLASKRFRTMTGGKYEIVYKEENKGATKAGLDMDVLDVYNAKRRNIGSLSGGESFMASLSLALSMSDIIQTKAGGISFDSMFIDEGFGSLDPEVLNCAMTEISKLSVSGKTVGLISHIEQLKDRIPTQVCVEKKEDGSVVTFLQ